MTELEVVQVSGSPHTLGASQGEELRDRVRAFMAMRFDAVDGYLRERGSAARYPDIVRMGAASLDRYREWHPAGYEEHCGIAHGAGVDVVDLYAATNMTDMRDAVLLAAASGPPLAPIAEEGCSSLLVPASRTKEGRSLAGQTWDLNPQDLGYVVAIHRKPAEAPESWAITCTGCLTIAGMNAAGVAVGTTNIKTYGSRPGVGYLGILHRVLYCDTAAAASEAVRTAPHAGAHTYWIADEKDQLEWEASPNGQFMRQALDTAVVRSNHCLSTTHVHLQGELPNESSQKRLAKMQSVLEHGQVTQAGLRDLFSDRSEGVHSINRYPEDEQGTATNAVLIVEPAERRLWACRGPADRGRWLSFAFAR